jgi:hypothetical protein
MKANRNIIPAIFVVIALAVMTGCEYNVKQPLWDQPFQAPATPTITQIDPPDSAMGGVNSIKIIGTHFASTMDSNRVYVDKTPAEIINASSTQIEIRRPNMSSDTAEIKVVPYSALVVAKYKPYKISPVWQKWGGFVENKLFTAMAVDRNNDIYMLGDSPRNIYKVSQNGDNVLLGAIPSPQGVTDAVITPDGQLLTMANNRRIYQVNVVTGDSTTWVNMSPAAKKAAYGDFDQYGNFWCGSASSDLILVKPDKTNTQMGLYPKDTIAGVRVSNGYLYLLLKFGTIPAGHTKIGIWRHPIQDANGTLGTSQCVMDWPATGTFASADSVNFAFSNDGTMYIGSTVPQILMVDLSSGQQDILYKNILFKTDAPVTWTNKMAWGTGNDLYMNVAGNSRYLAKVAMGKPGGQK